MNKRYIDNLVVKKSNMFIVNPYIKLANDINTVVRINISKKVIDIKNNKNFTKAYKTTLKSLNKNKEFKHREVEKFKFFNNEKSNKFIYNNTKKLPFIKKNVIFKRKEENIGRVRVSLRSRNIEEIFNKSRVIIKRLLNKKKKVHHISLFQIKDKIKKIRFYYKYYLRYRDTQLTKFFSYISGYKIKNSTFLGYLVGNIFYFLSSLKVKKMLLDNFVFVNKTVVKSSLFSVFKGDLIEIKVSKPILLLVHYNSYYREKFYSKTLNKKWVNNFRKKIPLINKEWKNYSKKSIENIDKYNSLINFSKYSLDENLIEIDFRTLTIIILETNKAVYKNKKLFDILFSGYNSKYKFLNWKYIS